MGETLQHKGAAGTLFSCQLMSPGECLELCAEMRRAPREPATASRHGVYAVRPEARRTKRVTVAASWEQLVMDRLEGLKARLAGHFFEHLVKVQAPQFLAYSVGDFFVPHQDDNAEPDAPEFLRNRRVSAVILLNPGDYEGGLLTLLGHKGGPSRFAIPGKAGRLIGFASSAFHEVTAVTSGERFSIASWYEAPSS